MYHSGTIRLAQRIYNAPFSYISYSEASLSLVKKWTKNPLIDDAESFFKNWSLIVSPSDHFMAAYVVLVVRFQFHFYFLAQVATKNRILVLFYGVLNSICYLGCRSWCCGNRRFCFVLWVLISFLLCNTKN